MNDCPDRTEVGRLKNRIVGAVWVTVGGVEVVFFGLEGETSGFIEEVEVTPRESGCREVMGASISVGAEGVTARGEVIADGLAVETGSVSGLGLGAACWEYD